MGFNAKLDSLIMAVWLIQTGVAVIKCRASGSYGLMVMVAMAIGIDNKLTTLFCQF